MSNDARRAAEAQCDQALADLDDLDVQLATGEVDQATADRLGATYAAEVADALAALGGPTVSARSASPTGDHRGPDAGSRRRRWPVVAGTVAILVVVAVAVVASARDRRPGEAVTGDVPAGPSTTAVDGATPTTRDLATVTDEELAEVVEANPTVIPMRLALVERYLRGGELEAAQDQAEEAAVRATGEADRARALRYLGWTTALLGRPQQGELLVIESLALEPANPNSLYFLGRIRFELLGDPAGAIEPLEQLAALDAESAGEDQAALVDQVLADVRAALADGAATPTTVAPP